jgi:hypothetical protein
MTSPNGTTWTTRTALDGYNNVAFSKLSGGTQNSIFILQSPNYAGYYTSLNGITWSFGGNFPNTKFVDSSSNNFSITTNGNPTQVALNPFIPTGYWSGYFDGTGDYLAVADNAAFDLAASNFNVETWVNFSALPAASGAATFVSQWPQSPATNRGWWFYLFNSAGTYQLYLTYSTNGTAQTNLGVSLPSAPAIGTWNHVAFVRSGNNFLVFWNGTQVGTTQTLSATIFNSAGEVWIGAQNESAVSSPLTGYQSNTRIVKGTAVYTANFTPPTSPLTAIANTSLLCLQDNRFKDNSTNAFTITRNGDARVSEIAPFALTSPLNAYGGSTFLNGSSDELLTPDSAILDLGSSDFTLEVFKYQLSGEFGFISQAGSLIISSLAGNILIRNNATNILAVSYTPLMGQWEYISIIRSGTTLSIFQNNTRIGTVTTSTVFAAAGSKQMRLGFNSLGGTYFNGNFSNIRLVKGSALSDPNLTTITVPTAPFTAITNTQLLLNTNNTTNWSFVDKYLNGFITIANNSNTLYTSADGTTWTSSTVSATKTFLGSAYSTQIDNANDPSILMMTSSTDTNVSVRSGSTWTERSLPASAGESLTKPIYFKRLFFIFSSTSNSNAYWTSSDGTTWTKRFLPLSTAFKFPVVSGGTLFIMSRVPGSYTTFLLGTTPATTNAIFASQDGFNWTGTINGLTNTFSGYLNWILETADSAVIRGNIVNVNNYQGGVSEPGISNYYPVDSTVYFDTTVAAPSGADYWVSNGSIAVGFIDSVNYYTTTDFKTFTARTISGFSNIRALRYFSNEFIVFGTGSYGKSSDGINWTVITGNAGYTTIFQNINNPNATGYQNFINNIFYANGLYIFCTTQLYSSPSRQGLYTSTDLITWNSYTFPVSTTNWPSSVIEIKYLNGNYIVSVGYNGGGGYGYMLYTTDFITYNSTGISYNFYTAGSLTPRASIFFYDNSYYAILSTDNSETATQYIAKSSTMADGTWTTISTGSNRRAHIINFDNSSGTGYIVSHSGITILHTISSAISETNSDNSYTQFADGISRAPINVGIFNGNMVIYDLNTRTFGTVRISTSLRRKPLLSNLSSEVGSYYVREV